MLLAICILMDYMEEKTMNFINDIFIERLKPGNIPPIAHAYNSLGEVTHTY